MVPFQAAVKTKPGIRISQGVVVSTLGTWAQSAGACRGVRDHVPLGDMTGTCICICTLFILRHLMRHDALHYGWIIDVRPLCRPEGGNGLLLAQSEHLLSTRPRCRGRRDSRVAVYHTSVDRP